METNKYAILRIGDKVLITKNLNIELEPYTKTFKKFEGKKGVVGDVEKEHWKGYQPVLVKVEIDSEENNTFWFRREDLKKIGG